jgi:hypothetical protein
MRMNPARATLLKYWLADKILKSFHSNSKAKRPFNLYNNGIKGNWEPQ